MNILFDVDDTLYDQTQPFKRAFQDIWAGQYDVDVDALYKVSRRYSNAIFHLVMDKSMSVDDSGVYRMQHAMKDFGYDIAAAEALRFQLRYRHYQGDLLMSNTICEMLTYCREHQVKLGVITNGVSEHQKKKIESLQLSKWIDPAYLYVSGDYDIAKPDIKMFTLVEECMQIEAEDTWFVGDSIEHDIVGAKNAGWHAIYFNRRQIAQRDEQPKADYEVTNEVALFTLIQKLIKEA